MTGDKKNVLYVALDESNHRRFPEVCVAIFSIIPEDAHKHEFFYKETTNYYVNFLLQIEIIDFYF